MVNVRAALVAARAVRRQLALLGRQARAPFELQASLLRPVDLGEDRVVWLPLSALTRWAEPSAFRRGRRRFVLRGDWDESLIGDLDYYRQKSRNYRSMLQIYREGLNYRECDQYRFLLDTIRKGDYHPDLKGRGKTEADLDDYFEGLQQIYEAIAKRGYRTQTQLGVPGLNEIRVVVDSDGSPTRFGGGNHRFAIAQVLSLRHVPVAVVGIHEEWARQRFLEAPNRDLEQSVRSALQIMSVKDQTGNAATEALLVGTQ